MERDELEELRASLCARERAIVEEGAVAIEPKKGEADAKPDDDEAPLTEMGQVIASKRNAQRSAELARVRAALGRIAEDPEGFGACAECDEPIAPRRLALMPWAPHCVKCAEALDRGRGGRRRHLLDFD